MAHRYTGPALAGITSLLAAGCAGESGLLSTSSVGTAPAVTRAAAPKVDPACVALTARIDALRKEGFVERVEKASAGKSASVTVKRESLAKMTELDKANAEFQSRCATLTPPGASAAVAPIKPSTTAAMMPAATPIAKP